MSIKRMILSPPCMSVAVGTWLETRRTYGDEDAVEKSGAVYRQSR